VDAGYLLSTVVSGRSVLCWSAAWFCLALRQRKTKNSPSLHISFCCNVKMSLVALTIGNLAIFSYVLQFVHLSVCLVCPEAL